MKLTTAARNKIPSDKFALPGRRYPVEDKSHAANARSRVSANGSSEEKAKVFSKTAHFFKKKKNRKASSGLMGVGSQMSVNPNPMP